MSSNFFKQLLPFLKIVIPSTIVLGIVQYVIINYFLIAIDFYLATWAIYVFHFIITLVILIALVAVAGIARDKVGFAFMACSLLKMFAAVVFLIPLIKAPVDSKIADAFAFFIPYFIFLGLETYFTLRLLQTAESSKNTIQNT